MLLATNELFQNANLRKLFIPTLSAEQKCQFLYDYLVKMDFNKVAEYFNLESDINWLCQGSHLLNLMLNNVVFASFVLQRPLMRDIFNLTSHHFFLVLRQYLNNQQQIEMLFSEWADTQFVSDMFIDAIKYGHSDHILFILENNLLLQCVDLEIIKQFIEGYDIPYISWNKSLIGRECYEKLRQFCTANDII